MSGVLLCSVLAVGGVVAGGELRSRRRMLTNDSRFNATVLGSKDADKEGAADADNGKEEEEEAASE